jgi:membrane protein
MLGLLSKTYQKFGEDKAPAFAAALAFFTIFSIAPILIIVIGIVSLALGSSAAQGQLVNQLQGMVGPQAAQFIQQAIQNTNTGGGSVWATVVGFAALLIAATGLVVQLKDVLNTIWGIKPAPKGGIGGIVLALWSRLVSLLLILFVGILLLIFFSASSVLYNAGHYLSRLGVIADVFIRIGYYVFFIALITLLFGMLYKYLPDVRIRWKNVWVGAAGTALLFVLGNFLISFYLGRVGVGSTFGASGSLVLVLLWIFYSAQIFLFGAEFTQVYTRSQGERIEPAGNAMKISGE